MSLVSDTAGLAELTTRILARVVAGPVTLPGLTAVVWSSTDGLSAAHRPDLPAVRRGDGDDVATLL